MDVKVEGAQVLVDFQIGPFTLYITETILPMALVTLTLMVLGILLGRKLNKRPGKLQVLTEMGVRMMQDLVVDVMGAHNAGWLPYIGTIFLSSLFGTLIGLTGFLRSTTADLTVVLTWSVMTSVIIWAQSIKRNGFFGWLKGVTEPVFVMTPMNLVSEVAQPIAMAFRHFGNVAGGGVITSIIYTALALASSVLMNVFSQTVVIPILVLALGIGILIWGIVSKHKYGFYGLLVGILISLTGAVGIPESLGLLKFLPDGIPILQFGLPALFSLYFDLFSGFVQAFVFTLLCMVYIAGACPPPEEKTAN